VLLIKKIWTKKTTGVLWRVKRMGKMAMLISCVLVAAAMDCSTMPQQMQEFAAQMTPANKAIFCGKFTDSQRASAMQMAATPDAAGAVMSPDEAVQKVSGAKGKVPTGCPVK
jgi:glucan phosphoethanolaminetransferase (alkaline phosphatase superfamily)